MPGRAPKVAIHLHSADAESAATDVEELAVGATAFQPA